MDRISTKSLLIGGLVAVGFGAGFAAGASAGKYLSMHRSAQEVPEDLLTATNPLLAGPLFADPGQRPLIDEPPDDPMNGAMPLGLA